MKGRFLHYFCFRSSYNIICCSTFLVWMFVSHAGSSNACYRVFVWVTICIKVPNRGIRMYLQSSIYVVITSWQWNSATGGPCWQCTRWKVMLVDVPILLRSFRGRREFEGRGMVLCWRVLLMVLILVVLMLTVLWWVVRHPGFVSDIVAFLGSPVLIPHLYVPFFKIEIFAQLFPLLAS